jgi:hypothetical protein
MPRATPVVASIAFAALAFVAGRELAPRVVVETRAARPAPIEPAAPQRVVYRASVDTDALRVELRQDVRDIVTEELARAAAPAVAPAATAPTPAPPPEVTADQQLADQRGEEMVASARAARRWTRADVRDFRVLTSQMSPSEAMEARQAIAIAVNEGAIVPDVDAVPVF